MFGIIEDIVACPQCGMPATKNSYHITGEESVVCNYCGYTHDKTLTGSSESMGYGCIRYVGKDENGNDTDNIIRLRKSVSLLERHEILMDLSKHYDVDKCSFYVWDVRNRKLDCIIGTKPMTLEEYCEQQRREAEYMARQRFITEPEDWC